MYYTFVDLVECECRILLVLACKTTSAAFCDVKNIHGQVFAEIFYIEGRFISKEAGNMGWSDKVHNQP